MTPTLPQSREQWGAAYKLERLSRCTSIRPYRPGDDELVCAWDGIGLVGDPFRHDPEEIRLLRSMAEPTWPGK